MNRLIPLLCGLSTCLGTAMGTPVRWRTQDGGNGHFYEVIRDRVAGWNDSRQLAISAGGYLATITSAGEQRFVESLLVSAGALSGGYWIGLRETIIEGEYMWITGEPLVFTNWEPGEPNNFLGLENHGHILWTASPSEPTFHRRGHWNDASDDIIYNPAFPDLLRGGYVIESVPSPGAVLGIAWGVVWSSSRNRRGANSCASRCGRAPGPT
ncbi:MAG: hypothetical protein IT439_11880 [Phycisphaerales bacterium]|nr:hypothetical protein [Phycisphaerales bacterium]